jgi:MFS family permease
MTEPEEIQPASWVRDFVLVAISRFGIFFSFRQVNPVFPVYLASLGASGALIGFIMSSFTMMATVSRPFVGMLIDRSGRKRYLLLGIVLLAVATLGYAWAPGLIFLVIFRMVHGLGWSGCTTTVSTLAADIAPGKRRGAMIAYAGLASNVGGALGPIAGFAAYYRYGFHGMFLVVLGVILLSLIFALPIKEPHREIERDGGRRSWWELLFVRESFLPGAIMGFLAFGHAGISTYIPLFVLQEQLGNPAYYFAVEAGFVIICRPIAGPLSDRFSRHAVIIPGLILQIVGLLLVAFSSSMTMLLVAAAINGLGFGSAHPGLMTLAIDWVPPARRGLSMAQFQTFHDLGIGIGAMSLGILLDLTNKNFSYLYLVSAVVVIIGSVIFLVFGKQPPAARKD